MSSPISLREQEPWKTTRLIGRRCTRSNALSRPVLIARGLDGFYPILSLVRLCSFEASGRGRSRNFSVAIARGKHLFPFRTEKLSLSAPMVLGLKGPGRVGRRRLISTTGPPDWAALRRSGTPRRRARRTGCAYSPHVAA